jgi:molybdopterin adenylyltransferase
MAGRVVSVNTNAAREFRKLPQPMARLIDDFGLEGDRHAGRPLRQVSLIEVETVRELAERGMPVAPGSLGENLTLEGVAVTQLPVGARLRLGVSAELEVTGERPACRELLEVHPDALKALIGRTGKMARVVRGGPVRPGDAVDVLSPLPLGAG